MKALEFDSVTCSYQGVEALDDISMTMAPGEVVGLVGRNGAGKTTLIRAAMGMLKPQKGSVSVLGLSPFTHSVMVKERVGYVSEDQILPGFLKAIEVLNLYKALYPKTWDDHLARELAGSFHLPTEQRVKEMSKGQARQLALVCAVSHRPELLILDEPAGGLDPLARREFLETSIRFLNDCGSTILFSSHHMTDVERMSSRLILLHRGKVLMDREMDDLKEENTLVVIPDIEGIDRIRIREIPGCVALRQHADCFHAVFNKSREEATRSIETELELRGLQSRNMALEELFIEITGGQN